MSSSSALNKNESIDIDEKSYRIAYNADQVQIFCFLNTCLAYEKYYTRMPCSVKELDAQSGVGASRFFFCAKASKRDRGNDNVHPTVKSTKLMEYLIRLITPPQGSIVLDPFMGSGSTGVAAKRLGFNFVGIERELEYFQIAEKRIEAV